MPLSGKGRIDKVSVLRLRDASAAVCRLGRCHEPPWPMTLVRDEEVCYPRDPGFCPAQGALLRRLRHAPCPVGAEVKVYVAGYRLSYHFCPCPHVRAVVAYVRGVSVLALFR